MLTDGRTGDALVKSHECPECRETSTLVNRWNREANSYEVMCGRCKRGDGFAVKPSLYREWKRNPESVPVHIANRFADMHRDEIEEVAGALPPELGETIRERYLGMRIPMRGEKANANQGPD